MNVDLRNPQVLNGEMFPRNHYLGLESVRKLHDFVFYLKSQGINLMAIPTINEVEAGLLDEDFEAGTILGVATPLGETNKDTTQIVVWDGYGLVSISILMYLHKQANNWKMVGDEGYQKPNFGHVDLQLGAETTIKSTRHTGSPRSVKNQSKQRKTKLKQRQKSFY